jgi:hypothetical protein
MESTGPSASQVSRCQSASGLPRLQLRGIPPASGATGTGSVAGQRKPGGPSASAGGAAPDVTPPKSGIDKAGFIDNSDGANIRTGPAESGGQKVRDQPFPPATRVFVSGTHPSAPAWWYVTAYLDNTMVRGYVQDFRVSWIQNWPDARPGIDENGTMFATRMMNKRYGVGGWEKVGEHNTEFSQLKKFGDRAFE